MENQLRMVDILDKIRQTAIFREMIPQEAGIGWPIPLRKLGLVYITLPFYGYAYNSEYKRTDLFPPFATMTVNWQNLMPVEYVNLRFRNPWPEGKWEEQAGTFPHPAVARLSVSQYQQKREQLLSMYDEMLTTLAEGKSFSTQWKMAFEQMLRLLLEPGLEAFYRALAPKFFDHFLPLEKKPAS